MLLLLSLAIFLPLQSPGLSSDGARYVEWIAAGSLTNPHFAYLPLAAVWAQLPHVDAHGAGTRASAHAAAFGCAILIYVLWRQHGARAALLAAALALFLSPALRFHAGAVEVHATAFACAASAWSLIGTLNASRRPRRRSFAGGFLLVLGHLSSCLWLPALALAAAARRTRELDCRTSALAWSTLLGGVTGLALIFACGWNAAPLPGESASALRIYLDHWLSGVAMPPPSPWIERWMSEVSGPFALLIPLAAMGAALACLRRERGALALCLALLPGPALALWIGAVEQGAYLLPGLPAIAFAVARALRALRHAALSSWMLMGLAILSEAAARLDWTHDMRGPRAQWTAADMGLATNAPEWLRPLFEQTSALVWILASFAAAILCAASCARPGMRRPAQRRWAWIGLSVVLIAVQWSTQHAHAMRMPARDQRELASLCHALRLQHGHDASLLLTIEATQNARAILERALATTPQFVPARTPLEPARGRAERSALRRALEQPGARFFLPHDSYATLIATEDFEGIDWLRACEADGLVQRLSKTAAFRALGFPVPADPEIVAYAARAQSELEPLARLITCLGDPRLRAMLAAELPRPFIDLCSEPLPPATTTHTWYLCDRGLSLWLERCAFDPQAQLALPQLHKLIAAGALRRWSATESEIRKRADAFWESTPSQR